MLRIDNFALEIARCCKKKYFWRIVEGLISKEDLGLALAFGLAVHDALVETDVEKAAEIFRTVYKKNNPPIGEIVTGSRGGRTYDDKRSMLAGETLIRAYFDYYKPPEEQFEIIQQEIGFSFQLAPPSWPWGQIIYEGRIDARAKFKMDDTVRVIEHKTSSYPIERICYNPHNQITGYLIAEKIHGGEAKEAMVNHLLVSRYPKDYESKDGSVPRAFARIFTARSDIILNQWVEETIAQCREIQIAQASGVWPRNSNWCTAYNGICEYKPLCTSDEPHKLYEELYRENKWKPWEEDASKESESDVPSL